MQNNCSTVRYSYSYSKKEFTSVNVNNLIILETDYIGLTHYTQDAIYMMLPNSCNDGHKESARVRHGE